MRHGRHAALFHLHPAALNPGAGEGKGGGRLQRRTRQCRVMGEPEGQVGVEGGLEREIEGDAFVLRGAASSRRRVAASCSRKRAWSGSRRSAAGIPVTRACGGGMLWASSARPALSGAMAPARRRGRKICSQGR